MSREVEYGTDWKQRISTALGVRPGQLNYTLDGAVEKIEDLVRDSAARERERERAASLPEPDVTNPDHLRFAADIVDAYLGHFNFMNSATLRAEADRLDAARSAEREREQRIEAARTAFVIASGIATSATDGWMEAVVDALDALRGGGRGE